MAQTFSPNGSAPASRNVALLAVEVKPGVFRVGTSFRLDLGGGPNDYMPENVRVVRMNDRMEDVP